MSADLRKHWPKLTGRSRDRLVGMALGWPAGDPEVPPLAAAAYFPNLVAHCRIQGWTWTLSSDASATRCVCSMDGAASTGDRPSVFDAFALAVCLRAGVECPEEWLG